jgi:hypothetical protein
MLAPVAVETVACMDLVPLLGGGTLGLATTLLYGFDASVVIFAL